MRSLDHASLSSEERAVLDAFLRRLNDDVDDRVHDVWLFGSRARGEQPAPLSDIDVLVIADHAGFAHSAPIYEALHAAAREAGYPEVAWTFSVHLHDPTWLARRRAVGSPFIAELERDHITLRAA